MPSFPSFPIPLLKIKPFRATLAYFAQHVPLTYAVLARLKTPPVGLLRPLLCLCVGHIWVVPAAVTDRLLPWHWNLLATPRHRGIGLHNRALNV